MAKTDAKSDVTETDNVKKQRVNLDTLLTNELGEFGLYQLRCLALIAIPITFIAWSSMEYVFTAARIPTRCLIPECESSDESIDFIPEWIFNAIPSSSSGFDNCRRYAINNSSASDVDGVCPAVIFDQQTIVSCDEYVYENTNTIVYDFGLACDEWQRSMVGSIRILGVMLALPLVGYISDRWGRRTALAISSINSAWIGISRYFVGTYVGFVASEFLEATIGSGRIPCTQILAMEIVGPKYRTAVSAIVSSLNSFGLITLGLLAYAVPNWRMLTLTVYLPQLASISFFWILPESVRWYLTKRKYPEAEAILKKIARVNKKQLSEISLQNLKESADAQNNETPNKSNTLLVVQVFRNKAILLRCIVASVWWISNAFVYHGLTVNSVNISGNSYVNFIAVAAVDIPGFILASILMNLVGRKPTLIAAFGVCAGSQLAYHFIPLDLVGTSLAVYLIGKCCIASVMTTLNVYTTELFPTKYRHRLFAFCFMMGRIGAVVAPLTPAFGDQLPYMLFGGMALLAGLLVLLMPETRGAVFPDTMRDAVKS